MMTPSRRRFLRMTAAAVVPLGAFPRPALAQAYPSRPLRLIIGYPPGGSASVTAHLVTEWLAQRLGASFVVESRPGAATNIATEAVVRAPADGCTLLLIAPANAINATLYEKLNYNFLRDIAPVAPLIRFPDVMVVNLAVPATTVPEFIAYAKQGQPGQAQHGLIRQRIDHPRRRRAVQDDDRGADGARPLSRRGPCPHRFDRRPRASDIRQPADLDRVHPRGQAARTRGDHGGAIAAAPGFANRRRFRAGL
jgi:hypothetical protein